MIRKKSVLGLTRNAINSIYYKALFKAVFKRKEKDTFITEENIIWNQVMDNNFLST